MSSMRSTRVASAANRAFGRQASVSSVVPDVFENAISALDLAGNLTQFAPLPVVGSIFGALKTVVGIANVSICS